MAFTLSDLQCLRSKGLASHLIGQIPPKVISALGWDMPWVYLSSESCIHIFEEHPDLREFDVLALPAVINRGLLIRETHRPRCLVASYLHEETRYIATMKRASSCEIWITTFHRSKPKQTKALLKKEARFSEFISERPARWAPCRPSLSRTRGPANNPLYRARIPKMIVCGATACRISPCHVLDESE